MRIQEKKKPEYEEKMIKGTKEKPGKDMQRNDKILQK